MRGTDRLHNSIVTRSDVTWAEAGTHLHHNGTQKCWRWAVEGRHREVVQSLIISVDSRELDWAVTNVVGRVNVAENGNILKLVSGDNDILSMLLDAGGNACSTDDHGTCALLHAVEAGQTGVVRTLLRRAQQSRAQQHSPGDLTRALEYAIRDGNTHMAVLLLLHGADPPSDIYVPGGYCPIPTGGGWATGTIEFIAKLRHWDLLVCILQRHIRLDRLDRRWEGSRQAGIYFAETGNVGAVEKLVEEGWHMKEHVLCRALEAGQNLLVDRYFPSVWARRRPFENQPYNKSIYTTLFLTSCKLGRLDFVVKMLTLVTDAELEAGLTHAARAGRYRIVELLLAVGISPQQEAILEAARGRHSLVFQILLKSDPSSGVLSAGGRARDLMDRAIEGGNLDIVRTCLTRFDVHEGLRSALTRFDVHEALRSAARNGRWDIAKLFLRHLPAGSSSDLDWTFNEAAIGGNAQLLHALWERGVDVCIYDNQPLRDAAVRGHAQAVGALLHMGATVDTKRSIALRTAVLRGHAEVVQEFLNAGGGVDGCSGQDLLAAARVNRVLAKQGDFDHVDEHNQIDSLRFM